MSFIGGAEAQSGWRSTPPMSTGRAVPGSIGRANLDGTGVDERFISGLNFPIAVAVDAAHVYWTDPNNGGTIGRANLDGTGVDPSFISAPGPIDGVAVDAAHVYWAQHDAGTRGDGRTRQPRRHRHRPELHQRARRHRRGGRRRARLLGQLQARPRWRGRARQPRRHRRRSELHQRVRRHAGWRSTPRTSTGTNRWSSP